MIKELHFLFGIIASIGWLYIFFGSDIKCDTDPKIKININPIIINSKLYIYGKHIHHWFVGLILLCILLVLYLYIDYDFMYFLQSFSIILILHGLLYQDCFDFDN
jgi:hypothetical protein